MRVCGSDGCARCPSQARRTRSVRAGSVVCTDRVAQSTSHTTRRPPARKARYISASAAGTSATYSSTCTDSAASKLALLDRQRGGVRLVERDVVVSLAAMRRHCEHRLAAVDADHRAVGSHLLEQLGGVEPGSAAHVQDAFARRDAEGVADQLPAAQHVARAIEQFEPSRGALVELDLAHSRVSLGGLGLARVEPELEERAQVLAGRQHVLVARPAGRQLHDPDVVVAAAVAAFVRSRFIERRQRSTTAEKAHTHGISRAASRRKELDRSLRPKTTRGPDRAPPSTWSGRSPRRGESRPIPALCKAGVHKGSLRT